MIRSSKTRRVSIIIPVHNNSHDLQELAERIVTSVKFFSDLKFEIVFVNDGSYDNSLEQLLRMKNFFSTNEEIKIIDLEGNFGQLGALIAGYSEATGEAIITMSADLQDPPETIVDLINGWLEGNSLVVGVRAERSDSLLSRITSKIAYSILISKNDRIPQGGFDFYLMSREIMNYLLGMNGRFRFLPTDLMRLSPKTLHVNYHRHARKSGKSGYSILGRWQIFLTAIVDTSYRWIQLFSLAGLVLSVGGFGLMSSVIYGYFNNRAPFQGFTLIICLILISSGLQLIILSLVGEYAWRTYDIARKKPLFVVRAINTFNGKRKVSL